MTALAATRVGADRPDHADSYRGNHWTQHAACAGVDVEIFYPPGTGWQAAATYDKARRICDTCPVRTMCADAGRNERHGMWGGLTPDERGWDSRNGKRRRKR